MTTNIFLVLCLPTWQKAESSFYAIIHWCIILRYNTKHLVDANTKHLVDANTKHLVDANTKI